MNENENHPKRNPLTLAEVRQAFEPLAETYPPVLGLDQASQISGYTPGTLKKKLSQGCFRDCVSRGKPLLFWRDRFVLMLMNRNWSSAPRLVPEVPAEPSEASTGTGGEYEAR